MADTYNISVNGRAGKGYDGLPEAAEKLSADDGVLIHRGKGLQRITGDQLARGVGELLEQSGTVSTKEDVKALEDKVEQVIGGDSIASATANIKSTDKVAVTNEDGDVRAMSGKQIADGVSTMLQNTGDFASKNDLEQLQRKVDSSSGLGSYDDLPVGAQNLQAVDGMLVNRNGRYQQISGKQVIDGVSNAIDASGKYLRETDVKNLQDAVQKIENADGLTAYEDLPTGEANLSYTDGLKVYRGGVYQKMTGKQVIDGVSDAVKAAGTFASKSDLDAYAKKTDIKDSELTDDTTGEKYILGVNNGGLYYKKVKEAS